MLCFSITAHERLDVLGDQITNVLSICPKSIVIVHLNYDFMLSIQSTPNLSAFLQFISLNGSVVINPINLHTRWGHMFHAHISNYHHLEQLGISYSALVLMSSGDLIFRAGIEEQVNRFDSGFDGGPIPEFDTWFPFAMADNNLLKLTKSVGLQLPIKDLHEGTFYKRELVSEMVSRIEAVVENWDYDDRYPKEEFFFPTLAYGLGVRRGPQLAHVMRSNAPRDRKTIALIIRDFSPPKIASHPALREWIDESIEFFQDVPIEHEGRFIVSRVPRDPSNIIRVIISNIATGLYPECVSSALDNMTLKSRLQLDSPAHKPNIPIPTSMSKSTSAFLSKTLSRLDLIFLGSQEEVSPCTVSLEVCPLDYLPPIEINKSIAATLLGTPVFICGAFIIDNPIKVGIVPLMTSLAISFNSISYQMTRNNNLSRQPFLFLFFEICPNNLSRIFGLEVEISRLDSMVQTSMACWMECHTQTSKEYFRSSRTAELVLEERRQLLWFFEGMPDKFQMSDQKNVKAMIYVAFYLGQHPSPFELIAVRGLLRP